MSERLSTLVSFMLGLAMTIAALFLVTGWDFHAADVAAGVVFLLGVGVGVCGTKVWYGIGRR